jgi:hypothetical protein
MITALILGSGLCWTATYILIIWRGIADRTYGMPVVALAANLSWEFIFSVVRPPDLVAQHIVNYVWLALDLVILVTVVRYGPREFRDLPKPVFYVGLAGTLVLGYVGVDLVSREFDNGGPTYVAFAQNLMMSALFLSMLAARRTMAGQSVSIAVLKMVGTALASVWVSMSGNYEGSEFLLGCYLGIFALDLAYVVALLAVRRYPRTAEPAVGTGQSGLQRLSDATDTATVP